MSRSRRNGRVYSAGAIEIKLFLGGTTEDHEVRRFLREIRAMSALRHPNVLLILDSGVAVGSPYDVMHSSRRDRFEIAAAPKVDCPFDKRLPFSVKSLRHSNTPTHAGSFTGTSSPTTS